MEDPAVDLKDIADDDAADAEDGAEDGDDDAEPEDDFNAAWEVLDLARAIYARQAEDGADEEVQLKLADTYIALGDVSLETGTCAVPLSPSTSHLLSSLFNFSYLFTHHCTQKNSTKQSPTTRPDSSSKTGCSRGARARSRRRTTS